MNNCSKPCNKLLENTCREYGDESRNCRELKLYLKNSSSETQRSCSILIKILNELNKDEYHN